MPAQAWMISLTGLSWLSTMWSVLTFVCRALGSVDNIANYATALGILRIESISWVYIL